MGLSGVWTDSFALFGKPAPDGRVYCVHETGNFLIWAGERGWAGGWRTEAAEVELDAGALRATGTQLATDPLPYRLDYRLR